MKLDSANRSFFALVALAMVLYIAAGTAACVLLSVLVYRLATDGTSAWGSHGWAAIPAALFLTVTIAGLLLGVRSLGDQFASSRKLRRRLRRLSRSPSGQLATQAREAGLGQRLRVIDSPEPFSFAYGALRPRVVVSTGLLACTSEAELRAVLVHERYHVRNLDPLKVVLARAASATFFPVPALRALERSYLASRELAADRRAVRACGREPLVGALLKVVRGPQWPELGSAASIGGAEVLDERVSQLESGRESPAPISRLAFLASAVVVLLMTASFATAVIALGSVSAAFGMSNAQMTGPGLVMCLACTAPLFFGAWLVWRWYSA